MQQFDDADIELCLSPQQGLEIKKKYSLKDKPSLSTTGWHRFQTKTKPQEVKAVYIYCVNIGYCQQEVFHFIAQCINIRRLNMDDAKDNSYKNNDIVAGLTKVLPRLNKLQQVHIYRINLGSSQVFRDFNSPDLRGIALVETELLGTDDIFMSSLHKFPLLSSLDLYISGLKKEQLLKVLTTLPLSCPCIVHLSIYPTNFTSEETKPICELKKLISLEINFKTNNDCLTALDAFPQPLKLLNLYSSSSVSNVWTDFIEIISSYKKLHYLVFWEGVLKCREVDTLKAIMAKKGGRLVVNPKDKEGMRDFMSKLNELRYKIYKTESRESIFGNLKCKEEKKDYKRRVAMERSVGKVVLNPTEQRCKFESRERKVYSLKHKDEDTTRETVVESVGRPVVNPKAKEVMEDNKAQQIELRHRNHKNESKESKFCNLI